MARTRIQLRINKATGNYDCRLSGGTVLLDGENRWFNSSVPTSRSPKQAISSLRSLFTELDKSPNDPKLF